MTKATIKTRGDFSEDPDRPGTRNRWQAIYEARTEADARKEMAYDEAALLAGGLTVVRAHWYPPSGWQGSSGRLVAIFDKTIWE